METKITKLVVILLAFAGLSSCSTESNGPGIVQVPPTAAQFRALEDDALESLMQDFTLNVNDGYTTFVTSKGVSISIDPSCLTKNGNPVTGSVEIKVVEIFDRGSMLVANKPTTAIDGSEKKLLLSGGEFSVTAQQDGVEIVTTCGYLISVPTSLTGGTDFEMSPFEGTIDAEGELFWASAQREFWTSENPNNPSASYNAFVESFGWFNCDKFASFIGPMTEIAVLLPSGYNNDNTNIFIALSGEPNSLGYLYGNFPVGLNCHIILVSENDDLFSYAIKSIPSLPNEASYIFETSELQSATQAQVVAAINALP